MTAEALEALVARHQAELYRYLRFLGAEPSAAEDVAQEAFLAVFQGKAGESPPADQPRREAAWLRAIARNKLLMHWRAARSRPTPADPLTVARRLDEAEATWQGVFLRDGEGNDYIDALRGCLERLPADKRQTLDSFYRDRKSRKDIAAQMQISEDGVKSAMQRARQALADCIKRKLRLTDDHPAVTKQS